MYAFAIWPTLVNLYIYVSLRSIIEEMWFRSDLIQTYLYISTMVTINLEASYKFLPFFIDIH